MLPREGLKTARVLLEVFETNASNLEEMEPQFRDLLLTLADEPQGSQRRDEGLAAGHVPRRVCGNCPSTS